MGDGGVPKYYDAAFCFFLNSSSYIIPDPDMVPMLKRLRREGVQVRDMVVKKPREIRIWNESGTRYGTGFHDQSRERRCSISFSCDIL